MYVHVINHKAIKKALGFLIVAHILSTFHWTMEEIHLSTPFFEDISQILMHFLTD